VLLSLSLALFGQETSAPNTPTQTTPEAPFDPARLAIPAVESADALGLALALASDGGLDEALQTLASLDDSAGDLADRVARETARLTALRSTRDGYLAELAEKGGKLRLTLEGEKVTLRVEGVANGALELGRNKLELETYPICAIRPADFFASLGKRTKQFGPEWTRGYALLLGGEKRWKTFVRDESSEAAQLIEDADAGFEALLAEGRAVAGLNALSAIKMPTRPASSHGAFLKLTAFMEQHGQSTSAGKRSSLLAQFGAALLERMFLTVGVPEILHVPIEDLGDGRVRLTYEFDSAEEGLDFDSRPGYLPDRHRRYAGPNGEPERPPFTIADGSFGGEGWNCQVHKLGFEGALTLRYEINYGFPKAGDHGVGTLLVGMCDDAAGSYIGSMDFGIIWVVDKKRRIHDEQPASSESPDPATSYPLELRHDGEKDVTSWVEGDLKYTSKCGELRAGGVFLWTHADFQVRFPRLEIEGTISPAHSQHAMAEWIEVRLGAIGLGAGVVGEKAVSEEDSR